VGGGGAVDFVTLAAGVKEKAPGEGVSRISSADCVDGDPGFIYRGSLFATFDCGGAGERGHERNNHSVRGARGTVVIPKRFFKVGWKREQAVPLRQFGSRGRSPHQL